MTTSARLGGIAEPEVPTVVVRPTAGALRLDLGEVWRYRELVYFLAWRDISVRYKQTVLGALWAILQPLLLMIVFTLVFGTLARIPSDGLPYPVFVYAGLLPWQLFSHALMEASNSVVANERLITKVYFPRLIIPLSSVVAGIVDFLIAMALIAVLMAIFRVAAGPAIWALPLFALLGLAAALGVGLWLAALNVQFRDVRYTLPFLNQLWLLATPIVYPASLVPEPWRSLLGANPMAGVVEGFRWALLGTPQPSAGLLALATSASAILLVSGALYFQRMERRFADVI